MYGLCADLHCHIWSLFSTLVDDDGWQVNSRLKTILDQFDRGCKATKEAGGDRVYIAGDLFHVRGSLKTSVLNYVTLRLRSAAREHGVQIVIMPGNHDLEEAEATSSGNSTFTLDDSGPWEQEDQAIRIIQDPTFIEEDMVAIVPWQNTRDGLRAAISEVIEEIEAQDIDLCDVDLHLHTGINGVLIGMPDHGWSPQELADFGFDRVFSGHYHHHKVFEIDESKVVSIGALTHQTWSDVGTIAGFMLVYDDDFTQLESTAPNFIDFSDIEEIDEVAGNYVRVRETELDEADLKDLRDRLYEAGAAGVVMQAIAKNKVVTRNGATPGKSVKIEQSITDWIASATDQVDACKELEIEALDVLSEARST